jgi:HEPN domain-containing protein
MKTRSEAFFKEASKKLKAAKEELFKPAEDIVCFSVCKNSQMAVENYLKGYLIKNNIEITYTDTIDSLYAKCKKFDSNFRNIDMDDMSCKKHLIDSRYCSEINTVSKCFDIADNIDTYFRKKKIV